MSELRVRSRGPRAPRARVWVLIAAVIAAGSVLVVVALSGGPSSDATTVPEHPVKVMAPATPTPTPTPTPAPTLLADPWDFTTAHISAPSIGLEGDITEYRFEDLVETTVEDASGVKTAQWSVEPATKTTISWYSAAFRQHGLKSIPSASAEYCAMVYGHSYREGGAAFDNVPSLTQGAQVVITSGNGEVLTYEVVSREDIFKGDATTAFQVDSSKPEYGCVKLVTCFRDGPRDPVTGATLMNNVVRLRLVSTSMAIQPSEVPSGEVPQDVAARAADRLQ